MRIQKQNKQKKIWNKNWPINIIFGLTHPQHYNHKQSEEWSKPIAMNEDIQKKKRKKKPFLMHFINQIFVFLYVISYYSLFIILRANKFFYAICKIGTFTRTNCVYVTNRRVEEIERFIYMCIHAHECMFFFCYLFCFLFIIFGFNFF